MTADPIVKKDSTTIVAEDSHVQMLKSSVKRTLRKKRQVMTEIDVLASECD